MVANASSDTTPMIEAPALRSLRVLGRHRHEVTLEVAEAPENARAIDLSAGGDDHRRRAGSRVSVTHASGMTLDPPRDCPLDPAL